MLDLQKISFPSLSSKFLAHKRAKNFCLTKTLKKLNDEETRRHEIVEQGFYLQRKELKLEEADFAVLRNERSLQAIYLFNFK